MEKMLGVMFDCSRNAVLTVESVKKYADIIRKMGYNTLMLYTEDTYEVDNQPYFGLMRGRYSKAELKELDSYCESIGLELIPCIQTLAHLNCIFKWYDQYDDIKDCDDILLAEEEKTYALIEDMLSTLSQCFKTRKIHIGMDEAYKVGLGKYAQKHGFSDRFEIINTHLHKVCDIASKYGFEPMIWSDMFCKLAVNTDNYYEKADLSKIKEKAALPENISLVYWDYYSTDYDRYVNMLNTNKAFDRKVYFAGGAWTWKGFAPDNKQSIDTTAAAVKACNDCGVDGIFFTVWGDDGAECSRFAVLPSLMYAAETVKGNTDMDSIKAKFKEITGCEFDSFMLLDKLDTLGGKHKENPSKYMLYNDVFMGINDFRADISDDNYYKNLAQDIRKAKGKGEYEYIFDSLALLCDVLSVKTNLGVRTRKAYKTQDTGALKELVSDYDFVIEKTKAFHKAFQKLWLKENKPQGFEIQDIRLGGLIQRIESCKQRLIAFINKDISKIDELEEDTLEGNVFSNWSRCVTANVVSHIF